MPQRIVQWLAALDLVDLPGLYAAVLSSGLAVLRFIDYRRDRPLLEVEAKADMIGLPDPASQIGRAGIPCEPSETRFVGITVANHGRRPATVGMVALVLGGKRGEIIPSDALRELPIELTEGRLSFSTSG